MSSYWPTADIGLCPSAAQSGLCLARAQAPGAPDWPRTLLPAVLNDPTYINDTIRREHSPPA